MNRYGYKRNTKRHGQSEDELQARKKPTRSTDRIRHSKDAVYESGAVMGSLESKSKSLQLDIPYDNNQSQMINHLHSSYGNKHISQIIQRLQEEKGFGKQMQEDVRSEMEASFNRDFSDVRIHIDAAANKLAKESDAKAFTSGKDIFFSDGTYQPTTQSGKQLIGHELAHVVQQESGQIDNQPNFGEPRNTLEIEADAAGRQAVKGENINLNKAAMASPVQFQKVGPEEEEKSIKTTKDPTEILGKVLEAAKKTETGKLIGAKLKGALTTKEGMITLGLLAVPTLAVGFAEKMEVPQAAVDLVPKILKFEVGKDMEIALQPIYKGKLGEKPKEWGGMLTFTIKDW